MNDSTLEHICEGLARRINDEFPTFQGFDTRADAGEPGLVYVALRGAKHDTEVGEAFADRVADLVEVALDAEEDRLRFAVSIGAGMRDLLLQIEVRTG